MTAGVQTHAQQRIARLGQRQKRCGIGLRAGMRLHIGVIRAEQRLGAVNRQLLGDIGKLTPAVITLAGIALGVLIGEY